MNLHQQKWRQWLRACAKNPDHHQSQIRGLDLAMLTGQDARALEAIATCWNLYASSDDDGQRGALAAVRALLPAMQAKCRPFARELIAWALDWHDRERLWSLVAPEEAKRVPKPVEMPMSQHCGVHGDHKNCPGTTTLGTKSCRCACHE